MTPLDSAEPAAEQLAARPKRSAALQNFLENALRDLPWRVVISDWTGHTYAAGGSEAHWCGQDLRVAIKTEAAGSDLLRLDGMRFLERFLEGDVDLQSSPDARKVLLDCVGRKRPVLVDLSAVGYIDSSGVASLVESLQTAKKSGNTLVLVAVSEGAMRVLQLARLDKVFTICDTVEDGLKQVRQ